jgi:hypothetical protein
MGGCVVGGVDVVFPGGDDVSVVSSVAAQSVDSSVAVQKYV